MPGGSLLRCPCLAAWAVVDPPWMAIMARFRGPIRLASFRWSHVSVNIGLALAVAQFDGLPNIV